MATEGMLVSLKQDLPIPLAVEFTCQAGEIFVIVGPSGSGKTTVLRSIAGLYQPENGRITCHGSTWFDSSHGLNVAVQKRSVGLVFQDYALFPHLSVRRNIGIVLSDNNKQTRKIRIDQLLNRVHLKGVDERLPHQLSGGQQQRVAVARALARNPEVLLLDEPFSSVDQQTRRHLVRELAQLRNHLDIPIIHVTHDLNEARRIADKLCIIDEGHTLQVGTPDEVMSRPVSVRIAILTGHDNVYTGVVSHHSADNKSTLITWNELLLETPLRPEFEPGESVDWVIPASQVLLIDQSMAVESCSNAIRARLVEIIQLGEGSVVSIAIAGTEQPLYMNMTTHQIRDENLKVDSDIRISLLPAGIHLMKKRD